MWHGFYHYTTDFLGGEAGLLNPFFFLPTVWAAVAFWPRRKEHPLLLYFFCMGAPEFLCYFLFTLHSRVYLNWIAPSIVPFLCLSVVYWEERWRAGARAIQYWLGAGLGFGVIAVVVLHDGELIPRLIGRPLPPFMDVWQRVEGWPETAQVIDAARQKLLAEGKPVFIIGGHYSITGEMSFYLPEARALVRDHPLVYYIHSTKPDNQFFFWPGYLDRKGQNALYVNELDFVHGKPEPRRHAWLTNSNPSPTWAKSKSPITAVLCIVFKSLNAVACDKVSAPAGCARAFPLRDYDLAATLNSGQAFRWHQHGGGWTGIIGSHWVRLEIANHLLVARTARPVTDWTWLTHYLQLDLDLDGVLASFPDDPPMRSAVAACRGLRLLRQDPWESPRVLHSFLDQANRPNPPDHRPSVRMLRRSPARSRRPRARAFLPLPRPARRRDRGRIAPLQNGFSRAVPPRNRPPHRRRRMRPRRHH